MTPGIFFAFPPKSERNWGQQSASLLAEGQTHKCNPLLRNLRLESRNTSKKSPPNPQGNRSSESYLTPSKSPRKQSLANERHPGPTGNQHGRPAGPTALRKDAIYRNPPGRRTGACRGLPRSRQASPVSQHCHGKGIMGGHS